MKVSFLSLVAIASVVVAEQGVFSFKDVRGYEKCLATDHLVETTATEGGSQKRFMNQHEVGLRCIESAEKLLAKEKDKNKLLEFVKTTKRNHGHENSLGIIHRRQPKPSPCALRFVELLRAEAACPNGEGVGAFASGTARNNGSSKGRNGTLRSSQKDR